MSFMCNPHECARCKVSCKCGGRVYRAVGDIVEGYERATYVIYNRLCCECTGYLAYSYCDLCMVTHGCTFYDPVPRREESDGKK